MSGTGTADPGYSVSPNSQTISRGVVVTYRIALDNGRLASQPLYFDITASSQDSGGTVTYTAGSNPAVINNGHNYVDFGCSSVSAGTYTLSTMPRAGATDGTLNGPVTALFLVALLEFDVTPASQNVAQGANAQATITLRNTATAPQGGLAFALSSSKTSGVTYTPSATVTMAAGQNSVTFGYADANAGTDTLTVTPPNTGLVNPAAKSVQVVITGAPAIDYSLTMPATGTVGQAQAVTITLLNGNVAPPSGYAFSLSTSAGANGSFGMSSLTMAGDQNSVTTNYVGTIAQTDSISCTAAAPVLTSAHTTSIALSAAPPGNPGFTFTPVSLNALSGAACGPYTVALTGGAVAPDPPVTAFATSTDPNSGGLTFTLSTDEQTGGSFSTGNTLVIPAGQNSAQTNYTSVTFGTFHLTATPPPSGVTGGAQTVQAVISDPPPPPTSLEYTLSAPSTSGLGAPVTLQIDLQAGSVAGAGGYSFDLSTSSQGVFADNPLVVAAGSGRGTTTYTGSMAGIHMLASQGHAPVIQTARSVVITIQSAPVMPGFAWAANRTNLPGALAVCTITLLNGATAPQGGLTFALSTDQQTGGSFSSGANLTIQQNQPAATCNYDAGGMIGTFHLTATPPGAGVSGTPQASTVTFAPASSAVTIDADSLDVRVYNRDGTRKTMPDTWLESISFDIAEKGGYQTGNLSILSEWEQVQFAGTEYVDVRLWNQFAYRGYILQPSNEMNVPQKSQSTLSGCMEKLNGYLCRSDLHYGPSAPVEVVFSDIFNRYVSRPGRTPTLHDYSGVQGLGLLVADLAIKGKTVSQALNALCDLFPDQLIWGCDVEPSSLQNRLYIRPRADETTPAIQVYAIGSRVASVLYPRDVTKVINRIYLTGGKMDGGNGSDPTAANLIPNGSFEESVGVGELTSNILQNPSFDDDDALTGWTKVGSVIAKNFGRTGTNACELNNDAAAQEKVYQDIPVAQNLTTVHAACYWCKRQEFQASNQIRFDLLHTGTVVASSLQSPQAMPLDPVGYSYHRYAYDWTVTYGGAYDTLRVTYILANESQNGYAGQTLVDDCSLWLDAPNAAKSWRITKGLKGAFQSVDWQSRAITPYDGDVFVSALASATDANGSNTQANSYCEIATTIADRVAGAPHRAYYVNFYVRTPAAGSVTAQAGFRIYSGGALKATRLGGVTLLNDAWFSIACAAGSGNDCDAIEPFIRFGGVGLAYIDAAGLYVDRAYPSAPYSPDDTFRAVVDVTKYTPAQIGGPSRASITNFGEREAEVTNANVTSAAELDAFCVPYFRGHAIPSVQGKLSIKDAAQLVDFASQVRLINMPLPPPPLTPVRVHYQCSASTIDVEVELNNDRPSNALLLRLVAAGRV